MADLVSSGGTKHLVEEESLVVEETGTEDMIGSLNLTGGSENKACAIACFVIERNLSSNEQLAETVVSVIFVSVL